MENFDLGVEVLSSVALLYAGLDEIIEVHLGEGFGGVLLVELDAE